MKTSLNVFSSSGLWRCISPCTSDTQSTLTQDFGSKAIFPRGSKPLLLLSKRLSLFLYNARSSGNSSLKQIYLLMRNIGSGYKIPNRILKKRTVHKDTNKFYLQSAIRDQLNSEHSCRIRLWIVLEQGIAPPVKMLQGERRSLIEKVSLCPLSILRVTASWKCKLIKGSCYQFRNDQQQYVCESVHMCRRQAERG